MIGETMGGYWTRISEKRKATSTEKKHGNEIGCYHITNYSNRSASGGLEHKTGNNGRNSCADEEFKDNGRQKGIELGES